MSSMQSAPAHMAATTVTSFGDGLAAPDLIRGSPIWTFSASSRESPVWEANVITGTNPAYDTRLSSSNTAEAAAKLCDTCTDSAFLDWVCCSVRTTTIPVQRALSSFRHSTSAGSSVDRGLGDAGAPNPLSGPAARSLRRGPGLEESAPFSASRFRFRLSGMNIKGLLATAAMTAGLAIGLAANANAAP